MQFDLQVIQQLMWYNRWWYNSWLSKLIYYIRMVSLLIFTFFCFTLFMQFYIYEYIDRTHTQTKCRTLALLVGSLSWWIIVFKQARSVSKVTKLRPSLCLNGTQWTWPDLSNTVIFNICTHETITITQFPRSTSGIRKPPNNCCWMFFVSFRREIIFILIQRFWDILFVGIIHEIC